jgi:anti-anti-sigma regulatory factor
MLTLTAVGDHALRLEGEATVHFAQQLHDALREAFARPRGPVVIEVQGLEALDLLGAQILVALRAGLPAGAVAFTGWQGPVAEFLETAGLEHLLA